jgi:MarR family transcriptional regulator, temperature-dependent positive regulator of motility
MKKIGLFLSALLFVVIVTVSPAKAAYLPEYDKYIEVSYKDARFIADLLGLKNIPLGEQTASMSFEIQEKAIKLIEDSLGTEIDHYYVWFIVNGQPVLGIDPPVPML